MATVLKHKLLSRFGSNEFICQSRFEKTAKSAKAAVMFIRRGVNFIPVVAFIGFLLLALPPSHATATDDFDSGNGNAEAQDSDTTEPRLVRRNFLRFGKRSDPDQGPLL